jgi:hypothetical protein
MAAAAVSTPSVRRVSNRALKNESVAGLIHLKQEMTHASTMTASASALDKQQRLVAAYSGSASSHNNVSVSSASKLSSGVPSMNKLEPNRNYPVSIGQPMVSASTNLINNKGSVNISGGSDSAYAVRKGGSKVGSVVPSNGPQISDLRTNSQYQQPAPCQQQPPLQPYQPSTPQLQQQPGGGPHQHPGGSTIISNSGYNIVTSTANMIRRNSFGLLNGRTASASNNDSVDRTPSNATVSSVETGRYLQQPPAESANDDGAVLVNGGRPTLIKQNSTTRQMLNSIGSLLAGGSSSAAVSGNNSAAVTNATRKHSSRQVIPIDDSTKLAKLMNSTNPPTANITGNTSTNSVSTVFNPEAGPESSRTMSPSEEQSNGGIRSQHRSSFQQQQSQSIIGRVSSAIGLKQQPQVGSQGGQQVDGQSCGTVAGGKTGKLCCDKCDGRHVTEDCPHYLKNREPHPDAQKNFYKKIGGSSNLPGALIPSATVVRQPGDGSCLFHSLSYGLKDGSSASSLRAEICQFISKHPSFKICDTPLSDWVKWDSNVSCADYARRMSMSSVWGGGIEMACLSQIRNVNVHVYEVNYGSSRGFGSGNNRQGGTRGGSGSGFKRISAFDVAVEPEKQQIVRVLYCGGVHYGEWNNINKHC